jgi:hypothetical protein
LVEHHLAKVGVAGSNPVVRSRETAGQVLRVSRVAIVGALGVPQPCRTAPSVMCLRDLLVRPVQPAGVVLLDHPGAHVAEPDHQHGVRAGLQGHRRARVAQLTEPEPLESRDL